MLTCKLLTAFVGVSKDDEFEVTRSPKLLSIEKVEFNMKIE